MSTDELNDSDDIAKIVELIYEDSENSLKFVRDAANTWNTRLSVLTGLNATLIRFAMDLPSGTPCSETCHSCLLFKSFALILLAVSIVLSLVGIFPKVQETLILPGSQLAKSDGSEMEFRRDVIQKRDEVIRNFLELTNTKAGKFSLALLCLG